MEAVEFGTFAYNGIIKIPVEYRKDFSTDIKVILMKNNIDTGSGQPDIQERIAAAERLAGIASANALSLEDIKNERLARH